jgi:hypothetical protein
VASEELSGGHTAYARLLLLLLGEAAAGVFLYALFTFMPTAVQMIATITAWGVLAYDNTVHPRKTKSLGTLLCVITAIPVCACGIAWRITHEEVWSRLALTGACLIAGLIFLNRREEWLDS